MIWSWRYVLRPRTRLSALAGAKPREGALIRVGAGVADIHPWPELGDEPLDEQLARLARGETTPLTAASLRMAKVDGDARTRGASIFEGLVIPRSHWPADAGAVPDGFDTVKIKMWRGRPIDEELRRFRLRLDYNAALSAEEFLAEAIPFDSIDFVEDPAPYDEAEWNRIRRGTGLRLAIDRGSGTEAAADVVVVKPAVQEVPVTTKELVITSYMDHPVGQFGAAHAAASSGIVTTCGLLTHLLYEPDAFIEQIRIDGARLLPAEGTGIGFDDLLERLPWKRLT